jgi:hypothetical protein
MKKLGKIGLFWGFLRGSLGKNLELLTFLGVFGLPQLICLENGGIRVIGVEKPSLFNAAKCLISLKLR